MVLRYAESHPADLEARWQENPLAIVPWGALEWHGAHLPLGLDGFVAERFSERLAEETGGVLLPTVWLPITTLPHRLSLQVRTEVLRGILDDTLMGLHGAGARTICVVTGHYAQGHEIEMYEAALRAMEDMPGLRVFAATPLEVLDQEAFLDHAGRYETSQILAIRPDLVRLGSLPVDLSPKNDAVLGEDPRQGTAEEGERLFNQALAKWQSWIAGADEEDLARHYKAAFDRYQPYVEQYLDSSWEAAILAWWATK